MEIVFTGCILSQNYQSKCVENLRLFLERQGIAWNSSDLVIEIASKDFTIRTIKAVCSDGNLQDRLNSLLSNNTEVIIPMFS